MLFTGNKYPCSNNHVAACCRWSGINSTARRSLQSIHAHFNYTSGTFRGINGRPMLQTWEIIDVRITANYFIAAKIGLSFFPWKPFANRTENNSKYSRRMKREERCKRVCESCISDADSSGGGDGDGSGNKTILTDLIWFFAHYVTVFTSNKPTSTMLCPIFLI